MPIALNASSEISGTTQRLARTLTTEQEFERRLEIAVRSTQKPIRPPSLKDFFRDLSNAVKNKSESE